MLAIMVLKASWPGPAEVVVGAEVVVEGALDEGVEVVAGAGFNVGGRVPSPSLFIIQSRMRWMNRWRTTAERYVEAKDGATCRSCSIPCWICIIADIACGLVIRLWTSGLFSCAMKVGSIARICSCIAGLSIKKICISGPCTGNWNATWRHVTYWQTTGYSRRLIRLIVDSNSFAEVYSVCTKFREIKVAS